MFLRFYFITSQGMIFSILASVFRVLLLTGLVTALLGVKKTRFRHVSSRRTRIPRHHGETTLWLERLLNGILEMLYCSASSMAAAGSPNKHFVSTNSKHADSPIDYTEKINRADHRLENVLLFVSSLFSFSEAQASEWADSEERCVKTLDDVLLAHLPSEFGPATMRTRAVDSTTNVHNLKRTCEYSKAEAPTPQSFDFPKPSLSFPSPERCDAGEESTDPRPELIRKIEERVAAVLEDRGIAAWADFRIDTLGNRLPRIKAIHILHINEPHDSSNRRNVMLEKLNASTQPIGSSTMPVTIAAEMGVMPNLFQTQPSPLQQNVFRSHRPRPSSECMKVWGTFSDGADGHAAVIKETGTATFTHDTAMKVEVNPKLGASGHNMGDSGVQADKQPVLPRTGAHSSNRSPRILPLSPNIASLPKSSTGTLSDPISIEVELEVEYSGGLEVSLQADLSFMRGRHLPVYVRVGNVKNFRAHMRALLTLHFESCGMEFPGKPFLEVTIWLESDPSFDMTMHSTLTPLRIKDFFLFPVLAKFFLLRFLRSKMRHSRGPGVKIKLPLPSGVVDNGVGCWCNGSNINENHNTENKARNTTSETDSNILRQGFNNTIDFFRSGRYASSSSTPAKPLGGHSI